MILRGDRKDSLQCYLKEVAATHPLPAEEEVALARRIKKGDMKARAKLVEANLRFVITVAGKYQNRGLSLAELISAGNIGLVTAADRFDETKGFKFISYAVWWIRQSIQQTLAEHPRMVRLPMNRVELLQRIYRYTKSQQQDASHLSTEEEIAKELGVSLEMVQDTLRLAENVWSLDATFGDDDERSLMDRMADENQEPPDTQLMENSLKAEVEAVLDTLEERERKIITFYYGLDGAPAMTLGEIGNQFGLTRERIRQIKEKALQKLRYPNRARKLMPYAEEI